MHHQNYSQPLISAESEIWHSGIYVKMHSHSEHQLIYSLRGSIEIRTRNGCWILPPSRAIWISKGVEHEFTTRFPTELRVLHIAESVNISNVSHECYIFNVTPLLKEIVNSCTRFPPKFADNSSEARLCYVLFDQLETVEQPPLNIPCPEHVVLSKIWSIFQDDPATKIGFSQLASIVSMSERALERLFLKEVDMTFNAWRQRFRLIRSIEYLAEDVPITRLSYDVGYEYPSSYITAFKKFFGCIPAQYFLK